MLLCWYLARRSVFKGSTSAVFWRWLVKHILGSTTTLKRRDDRPQFFIVGIEHGNFFKLLESFLAQPLAIVDQTKEVPRV